ncbi:azurin [Vibrio alginolyticus]|uniref:azurin n=1 Tax=Vibrio sp. B1FLJ16 TaxID=2751178 RepID=UPI0015F6D7E3|nr:azurin [Vibrio sp. B1FLJ16]CAD7817260.1 Transfers electrons from cytochrome c551 to cytochrome oxidase [Vibrio sp. B1FLJ16]CAD7818385.1 Transfers electrons from cytochrome c551 to cytochrome oxidase [Vibrio sp. B1FLJ16]CAE6930595.1 Transfers electrons from cytochrome c551 to cytochrome oxidase [Vibrio sp. B1FLJ16]CAE6934358.1 Transfers electrons from cytochrome c551 to cytochrome oxidase [Vibrio sp. B1FLJ16]
MTLRILAVTCALVGISFNAQASTECEVSIDANDMMQFSTKTLSVPATCTEVKLTLHHTGKLPAQSMGHNVVIADTANIQAIGTDGMSAGIENNYIKPDDSRVYAHTDVIGGGESTSVTFSTEKMTAGGDYSFFCSFPGHWAVMQGKFEFK